jgi:hypothetical protein
MYQCAVGVKHWAELAFSVPDRNTCRSAPNRLARSRLCRRPVVCARARPAAVIKPHSASRKASQDDPRSANQPAERSGHARRSEKRRARHTAAHNAEPGKRAREASWSSSLGCIWTQERSHFWRGQRFGSEFLTFSKLGGGQARCGAGTSGMARMSGERTPARTRRTGMEAVHVEPGVGIELSVAY